MSHDAFELSMEPLRAVFDAAGHPDDGTIHTWVDGAFDEQDAARVHAHVTSCASCAAAVAEARGLVAATSRVLAALDGGVAEATVRVPAMAVPTVHPRRWWTTPTTIRAAAALFVVVSGTWVWRNGQSDGAQVVPAVAVTAVPSQSAQVPAAEAPSPAAAPAPPEASGPAATPASVTANAAPASATPAAVASERAMIAPAPAAPSPTPVMAAADYTGRGVAGGIARAAAPTVLPRRITTSEAAAVRPVRSGRPIDREQYDRIDDNPFLGVSQHPLSTFSIDVDRAAYGNVRRFLESGQRPPKDAVRIEELVNYFPYTLPAPRGDDPVSISSEVVAAPWQPRHRLVRVALQATRIETAALPPNNLVFLVDVSGSMNDDNKLPLVKQSLRLLVDQLRPQDRVAIVAYAGAAGLVLPSTSGDEKAAIMEAIDRLEAGGSTAGGAGIELAYRTAREHYLPRGNNRVILATDGDFNVGVSSDGELERLIEDKRRDGTYLTALGYGTGNYQASKMEKLAKVGNGNHAYVDNLLEARKVLVEEMGATLLTVANDVKLQVEFNPRVVQAYRLIGYENRLLADEDFNDDHKDAGDIGAGHQVTALYEVVPVGVTGTIPSRPVDSLRYTRTAPGAARPDAPDRDRSELLYVKLRYKRPGDSQSRLMSHAVVDRGAGRGSDDLRFAAAVASFGMLLRDSEYRGNSSAAQVLEQARAALGDDRGGYRADFVRLVQRWRELGLTAGERR